MSDSTRHCVQLTARRSAMKSQLTTTELAALVGFHEYKISNLFGWAFVGHAPSHKSCKLYCTAKVAEMISQRSGREITPDQLQDLITVGETIKILGRCKATLGYWRRQQIGPTPFIVGASRRFLRQEVVAWREHLSESGRGGKQLPKRPATEVAA